MKKSLLPHEWVKLPYELRRHLSDTFKIGKSSSTHVVNGAVVSDGTTDKDLSAMSLSHLIEYLGDKNKWYSESLFDELFDKIVEEYDKQRRADELAAERAAVAARGAEGADAGREGAPRKAAKGVQESA